MAMPEDEMKKLAACFAELHASPKMDTPEDLEEWMKDYVFSKLKQDGKELLTKQEPVENLKQHTGTIAASTTHVLHTPKIFAFSGEGSNTDTAFESWKYQILTLLREGSYSEKTVTTAVKNSLRGEAAKVVRRLGVNATTAQILDKFHVIYGRVEDPSDLLTEFHKATQGPEETVSAWCCRIEDILHRALEDDPSHLTKPEETLQLKFYSGLRKDIKDRIRHLKGRLREFDSLLFEARRAEMEGKSSDLCADKPKKSPQVHLAQADDVKSQMDTLKASICTLNTKVTEMADTLRDIKQLPEQPSWHGNYSRGNGRHRGNQRGYSDGTQRGKWGGNLSRNWNSSHQWDHNQTEVNQGTHHQNDIPNASQTRNRGGVRPRQPVICYRCGQLGHKANGCCADLTEHHHLNMDGSV